MVEMIQKRDKLKIIYDVLRLIVEQGNSIRPTTLLRHSNLSPKSFLEYKKTLIEKGLIKEIESNKKTTITLTDKGFIYLNKYKGILGFIEEFNL